MRNNANTIIKSKAAWAGMAGSVFFVIVFTIEGLLRQNYNPLSMYVSELSLGPRGFIQILNFMITGLVLFWFALNTYSEFKANQISRTGPVLLGISALSLFLSGPLVMDPASVPLAQWTWHGFLHQLIGAFGFFTLAPIVSFIFWLRLRNDKAQQLFSRWSLVITIIMVIAIIFLRLVATPPHTPNLFTPWAGLFQRTVIISYMCWIFTLAFKSYKKN